MKHTAITLSGIPFSMRSVTLGSVGFGTGINRAAARYEGYRTPAMPVMAYSSQATGFFLKAAQHGTAPASLGSTAEYL